MSTKQVNVALKTNIFLYFWSMWLMKLYVSIWLINGPQITWLICLNFPFNKRFKSSPCQCRNIWYWGIILIFHSMITIRHHYIVYWMSLPPAFISDSGTEIMYASDCCSVKCGKILVNCLIAFSNRAEQISNSKAILISEGILHHHCILNMNISHIFM